MNNQDLISLFNRIHNSASDIASECCYYYDNGKNADHNSRLAWVNQVKRDLARLNDAVKQYDDALNSL